MLISIIQTVGVFIASLYGFCAILRVTRKSEEIPASFFIAFAIGMAMAFSGLFF